MLSPTHTYARTISFCSSVPDRYSVETLPENYSGAASYGNGGKIQTVLMGLGLKSVMLIVVSSLCLFLASVGVCI